MWGMARATAEGPITHRTMVTTPNSSTKVRRNSWALCQMTVRGEIGFPCSGKGTRREVAISGSTGDIRMPGSMARRRPARRPGDL